MIPEKRRTATMWTLLSISLGLIMCIIGPNFGTGMSNIMKKKKGPKIQIL